MMKMEMAIAEAIIDVLQLVGVDEKLHKESIREAAQAAERIILYEQRNGTLGHEEVQS
mgnify:CR=1 FL=1